MEFSSLVTLLYKDTTMAEIQSNDGGRRSSRKGTRRRKKRPGVDMTAMVDVAFLLLTFFVLTAMMDEAKQMEVVMPPPQEKPDRPKVLDKKILTVLIDQDNDLHYYVGSEEPEVFQTTYSVAGIREVLIQHQQRADPIVVVKPHRAARYRSLVDMLDELAIVQAPKFLIQDFSPEDSLLLANQSL